MSAIRHITLPAGFTAAGVVCRIKTSGKEDLAIISADSDVSAAVLTTTNQVFGEPVRWCRKIMPKGYGLARAIVINAGCSNVCTGKQGFADAAEMAELTASKLGTQAKRILVASTGIIGHRLPMDKVRAGINAAAGSLGTKNDSAVLRAIMTTDTREKSAVVQSKIAGKKVTIAGIVKGAGMISPSLATMISVITTDAAVSPAMLHKALLEVAGQTYNAVTVDSDTSTSDTLAILASGRANNRLIASAGADYRKFVDMLREAARELARSVAADGEGATKLIEIAVVGARNDADAKIAAKAVADSPLFKCAVHGADPNWGRIAAALGKSAAKIDPEKLTIKIGGIVLFAKGGPKSFNVAKVRQHLSGKEVFVDCSLGLGKGSFTAFTCDYSREYIAINADYHT